MVKIEQAELPKPEEADDDIIDIDILEPHKLYKAHVCSF